MQTLIILLIGFVVGYAFKARREHVKSNPDAAFISAATMRELR